MTLMSASNGAGNYGLAGVNGSYGSADGQEAVVLAALPDEIRDARRVQEYGQEEDLKIALGRMIDRVEELVR